ncbi:XdhC family protein [Opitutaceae bacterium]|nr:XdhC family protein [Opitutaceae bacterium]
MSEIFNISQILRVRESFPQILATLVHVEGSSYRRTGARRLISPDGAASGSISGGCLEQDLHERATALLQSADSHELVVYDTKSENDLLWGTGTGCHGVVKILLEKIHTTPDWTEAVQLAHTRRQTVALKTVWETAENQRDERGTSLAVGEPVSATGVLIQTITPPPHVVIFGAGDDAMALSELIHATGWENSVCDPRPDFARAERFPHADRVVNTSETEAVTAFTWDDQTTAVVMTHHYRFDLPLLKVLVPMKLPYLGLLGPKERGARLLRDAGFDSANVELHNPVGLDLGGDGPKAVALSIVAEIQAHLHGRTGQPLSQRDRPIHDA